MKRLFFIKIIINLFFLFPHGALCQNPEEVWAEFRQMLKTGELSEENIRPVHELLEGRWMPFLENRKKMAVWEEWEKPDEIFVVDNKIHYLVKMTENNQLENYCLTFIIEDGKWYFNHAESIWIRFDKIEDPPTSEFPDLPESFKHWQREEPRIVGMIYLYNYLIEKESKEFAFNWFKDGTGYLMWVKTHIPFIASKKAFILAICYEQSRLRGSEVLLEKFTDDTAVITLVPIYLKLYYASGQIKKLISYEDYRILFETVWQDRAEKAGWKLDIQYENDKAILTFSG